jgi:hypothetical protein
MVGYVCGMKLLNLLVLCSLCTYSFASFADIQIRVRGLQSSYDASHEYYKGLILLAYRKINKKVTIINAPYMVQSRALDEMADGRIIDVYWAGSNAERESNLGFVKIPLNKGLLGFRVFAINKNKRKTLENVGTLQQLSSLRLCQGSHWPDTDIMLASGLDVMPNPVYENMFRQVYSGRCDAFPRGINEAQSEVTARQEIMPNLTVYQDLILYYPFPMYFFTKKDNTSLLNDLSAGLELALDDGSFDEYMKSHESTKHLFPTDKWIKAKTIKITNPFLSDKTDTSNSRYWITPQITDNR